MLKSIMDYAIGALLVLYVALSVILIVLILTGNISPLGVAGMVITMTAAGTAWALLRTKRRRLMKKGAHKAPDLRWAKVRR